MVDIVYNADGKTIEKKEFQNIKEKATKFVHYSNFIHNSNFERSNELGIPDFLDTTGIVMSIHHLSGNYFLKLTTRQYLKMKDKPILTYNWMQKFYQC